MTQMFANLVFAMMLEYFSKASLIILITYVTINSIMFNGSPIEQVISWHVHSQDIK